MSVLNATKWIGRYAVLRETVKTVSGQVYKKGTLWHVGNVQPSRRSSHYALVLFNEERPRRCISGVRCSQVKAKPSGWKPDAVSGEKSGMRAKEDEMSESKVDLAHDARRRAEVLREDAGDGVDRLSATLFDDLAVVVDAAREVSECFTESGPLVLTAPGAVLEKKIARLREAMSQRFGR